MKEGRDSRSCASSSYSVVMERSLAVKMERIYMGVMSLRSLSSLLWIEKFTTFRLENVFEGCVMVAVLHITHSVFLFG